MFKRKVQTNIDIEELEKKIDNLKKAVTETKKELDALSITAEMARAISKVRDNEYKKEWQPIVDKFLENCYRDIKKACSEGEFQQNKVTINYSAEEPYHYAANEARKELIKIGFKVTGNYNPCGGRLFIFW